MTISLAGGPLDGAKTDGLSHLPLYLIATNLAEKPVYKRMCCLNCRCNNGAVRYDFVGYEGREGYEVCSSEPSQFN
jgi:hypothetical protein